MVMFDIYLHLGRFHYELDLLHTEIDLDLGLFHCEIVNLSILSEISVSNYFTL